MAAGPSARPAPTRWAAGSSCSVCRARPGAARRPNGLAWPPVIAGERPPAGVRGPGGHRGGRLAGAGPRPAAFPGQSGVTAAVVRVNGHVRADGHHVGDAPAGQAGSEVDVLPVAGVGHHRHCHAPLLPVADPIGHPRAFDIAVPLRRREQPPPSTVKGYPGGPVADVAGGVDGTGAEHIPRRGDDGRYGPGARYGRRSNGGGPYGNVRDGCAGDRCGRVSGNEPRPDRRTTATHQRRR